MALIKSVVIRFKQSTSPDTVANRVRIHPANSVPDYATAYDQVTKPTPDADGYSRIPLANVPKATGLEGKFDVAITAVDAVGNESDFLDIDNQTFDLSPPLAPSDGSLI